MGKKKKSEDLAEITFDEDLDALFAKTPVAITTRAEEQATNLGIELKAAQIHSLPFSNENHESPEKDRISEEDSSDEETKNKDDPERVLRTVFVGNVPITCAQKSSVKKSFLKLFKPFGKIESVRFRSFASSNPKLPKKAAFISRQLHTDRSSIHVYIVYADQNSARNALVLNGSMFLEHHLRIDIAGKSENQRRGDRRKCIFVGNLPFNVEEDEIWNHFTQCGKIDYVRIIRDKVSGMGKGFGYVQFDDEASVGLAMQMSDVKFKKRDLRISECRDSDKLKRNQKEKSFFKLRKSNPKVSKTSEKSGNLQKNSTSQSAIKKQWKGAAKRPIKTKKQKHREKVKKIMTKKE